MSAISNPLVSASENLSFQCLLFNITLSFEWDTNEAPQESSVIVEVQAQAGASPVLKEFDNNDIISNVGGVLTYEQTFSFSRKTTPTTYFTIRNSSSSQTLSFSQTPLVSLWNLDSVQVSTDVNEIGTVTAVTSIETVSIPLNLEISIDNQNFIDSNTISGLTPGNYTLYIKDDFGCLKTEDFTVQTTPTIGQRNNFRFVSLLNSVPFTKKKQKEANFDNTPSYEFDAENKLNTFEYQYKGGDKLEFQFRSNYDVNKAYLLNCGEVVNELTVEQMTENLNVTDIRDMSKVFIDGHLHVYNNGVGDIYDDNGDVIGQNELNGVLLDAQEIGSVVEVESVGLVEILDIVEIPNGDLALKLNYTGTVSGTFAKVTTFLEPKINFEVFQFDFTIPENDSIDKRYQIALVMNTQAQFDSQNPLQNASYISEVILPFQNRKLYRFIWKNIENNQINWDTGIQCMAYFPKIEEPIFQPKDESEIYMTDTNSTMLEGDVYETYTFLFDVLSQIQARHLSMITSNEFLYIDDIFYVKEETPDVEALVGSNGYNVEMKLTVASNYNSNSTEVSLDALGVLPEDLERLSVLIVDGKAIVLNTNNGLFV